MRYPKPFQDLIAHFSSLPSIGPKMAERLTLSLFKRDSAEIQAFAEALESLHSLRFCSRCFHIAEDELCSICADEKRNHAVVCVVEEPLDVIAIERTGNYDGTYHVLGGLVEQSGGDNRLTIPELLSRVETEGGVKEVILAMNPTTEGDSTAYYLKTKLLPTGVRVSRIARGLATGGDIEYADEVTLTASLANRSQM
jgi:recombination protein RecR